MPRPERALDPESGPIQAFAAELRLARQKAGNPTYLKMARATGRSRTALAEAAGGDHLATWETVEAYLAACGQIPADWYPRWEEVRERVDHDRTPAARLGALVSGVADEQPLARRPGSRRLLWFGAGALAMLAAIITVTVVATSGGRAPAAAAGSTPTPTATGGPVTVVVQNKVAIGPTSLVEDSTPVYLTSRTIPYCSRYGCQVPGTKMWSGAVLQVVCQVQGSQVTNEDLGSPGITHNPGGAISTRWYRAEMPDGTTVGYIPEVYLTPASRGGLGLPTCPPA